MGTEVLRPQDLLSPTAAAAIFAHRRPNPKPSRKPSANKRRDKSPKSRANSAAGKEPLEGKVTILRRGEPLDAFKKKLKGEEEKLLMSLEPDLSPRRVALADVPYAGSGFVQSPAPSALPIPNFSSSKRRDVDLSATEDLRRFLRLE